MLSLMFAKRVYQTLPLGPATKIRHRNIISRYCLRLLNAVSAAPNAAHFYKKNRSIQRPLGAEPDGARLPDGEDPILIETSDTPIVSVIIPVYGQLEYTFHCLASMARFLPATPFEVIVIDDCSPDNSYDYLKDIKGINVLKNEENLGFIRSCNRGARLAKGKYIYFLNLFIPYNVSS